MTIAATPIEGRLIEISGTVQGVGFRPWVYRVARELGVRGSVRNGTTGVTIEAYGAPQILDRFLHRFDADLPPAAEISVLSFHSIEPARCTDFRIEQSSADVEEGEGRRPSIPADLPTCDRCLAETFDFADRRYRYPFTNCTDCGPRFTITRQSPYDRADTSMAEFEMCAACRTEYETADSRRFHAEPNACPRCGPRLELLGADGQQIHASDPLAAACDALAAGRILAVKGLGGYHLACDAANELAVATLRRRKRRDAKPFAVMCSDLAAAAELIELEEATQTLLVRRERPIVIARRCADAPVANSIAPGHDRLGVFLPYTPLHHLILQQVARPLVMTSANLSDEPSIHRDDIAVHKLVGIADYFLVHDREIVSRTDDSVATVINSRPTLLRRSRGYVPGPVVLKHADGPVTLGCGAHLKNTFCLAVGNAAYLGPHMGDLESLDALGSYRETIARMERFLDVHPSILAHDLHPNYLSTCYADERSHECEGVRAIGVQHHHAHIAAVMAEHKLEGPVLGLAWDGVGLGTDAALWGGELLLADFAGFRRLATFRPIAMAGGDTAVRQIWRLALAVLDDAFDRAPPINRLALFKDIGLQHIDVVRRMIATGLNAPPAHGVGRWFDAVAAIGLGMTHAKYEGQAAMYWEQACVAKSAAAYPFEIDRSSDPWQIDPRRTVRALVKDLLDGHGVGQVSSRFHQTLIDAGREVVAAAQTKHHVKDIVLAGGCFQNARLVEGLERSIGEVSPIHRGIEVPCGDGGLALGQVAIARAIHGVGRNFQSVPEGRGLCV
jgi:hydrogenase maturation protein HypF